jgi:Rrf2 family nitric oxide-sensitive transcriptional repressor
MEQPSNKCAKVDPDIHHSRRSFLFGWGRPHTGSPCLVTVAGVKPLLLKDLPVFSQTVEYAFRAMVALASGDNSPMTTKRIAEVMQVPPSYLSKVLQALVKGGLVFSTRGLRGGFILARQPEKISLLEIQNCVNPIQRIRSCPLDLTGHNSDLCPLHRRLDQAMGMVENAFADTTLGELLSDENPCPTLQQQLQKLHSLTDASPKGESGE